MLPPFNFNDAIKYRDHELLKSKLKEERDVSVTEYSRSSLQVALCWENKVAFEVLVDKGAKFPIGIELSYKEAKSIVDNKLETLFCSVPDASSVQWIGHDSSIQEVSCLHEAAEKGDSQVLDFLLKHTSALSDLNKRMGYFDRTSLYCAAEKGNSLCVQLLLEQKAETDIPDSLFNNTPLIAALEKGDKRSVELLLEHGAGFPEKTKLRFQTAKFFVDNGLGEAFKEAPGSQSVRWVDYHYHPFSFPKEISVLQHAAHFRYYRVMQFLLLHTGAKADINTPVGVGFKTPLRTAARKGFDQCVKLLLEQKASPNRVGEQDWTPLLLASLKGHTLCVKHLLDHGADVKECRKVTEESPLHLASNVKIAELLIEHKADIEARTARYELTPLHYANSEGIAKFLCAKGANIKVKNKAGLTLLQCAKEAKDQQLVDFLLSLGA